jgi:hypothetical protein
MMNTMTLSAYRDAFRATSTFWATATLSLCLVFGLARAQQNEPFDQDPPDRAARLSFLQGQVSLQPAGEEEWATAIVNRPLTTGDKLWTDQGARAEIYVGQAAVRLGSDTGFSFLNVDDDTIQMRLTAGVINVHVRALDSNDQIEVDTPNLALSLLRPGNYRVEVNDENDTTVVKVSEGEAEASDGSQNVVVHAQQVATFRGADQLAAQFGTLGAPDEFDSWSLERERRDDLAASSQTAQYVDPDVTGYEDLDANGTWSSDAEYGNLWTPTRVAVDWSPYRDGRWVWVAPWGWTWIDDAPWGYAPFHYGRWAHVRNRWCWVPGPRHVRAVYAPALVGWVGPPGVNVSISVGDGGVGWFPLGPREVYVPARRFSPRYVERVNVSNTIVNRVMITNVYNNRAANVTYRNRAVAGAVTTVSRTTFTSAQRVGDRRIRVDEQQIARARGTAVAPQIQPVRESRLGVSEAVRRNVRVPPQTVVNRQVIVKREPPPSGAHFARNRGQVDSARAPVDRSPRPQDHIDRGEAVNRGRPDNTGDANARADANRDAARAAERDRERAERNARAAPNPRDDRPPQTHGAERPAHVDQPQAEAARRIQQSQADRRAMADRQQEDQARQRQQQERQQQEQRQQQGQRERATQQREQQQQAVARQIQERQNRPEPQKPAENKPKPQQQQDRERRRQDQNDQRN